MTEKFAKLMVKLFGGIGGALVGKYITIFIISLMPILELRGGLIAAKLLGLPPVQSFIICFIGNILPIPIILWLIEPIFNFLKRWKWFDKFITWCEKKAHSKKEQIENLKYLGLFLFVGIPLPGTGAWTGCLIASLIGMDKKKSMLAAILGVVLAGIIMLIFSYGVLGLVV
ncbi:MAG: small multi-drug export protein [Firmicutes bacterium]|nr:small multi-drug export protein [Bacillota bacterium]